MKTRSSFPLILLVAICMALSCFHSAQAAYVGTANTVSANSSVQAAAMEILGNGGGSGTFTYKGGGNAVDAAVAAALAACVVNPGNCSLGGYGGHMMIYKSGLDGQPQLVTCIDFNSAAGSLASSNMFANSVDPTTGKWTAGGRPANQYGWKAVGVPANFAGLYMAQTNYGRKVSGTNYLPFAEILKPSLARVVNGDVAGTAYYTLTSVSNLLMDLYTNSPGYTNIDGTPNLQSNNDPYAEFYRGGIAQDIVAAMEANGGLVTYADMTNYRPREVTPYTHHFNCPNGTPATVYTAPPGASGVSVLQQIAMMEALGWTNGPNGTWDSLHYWHSRAEASRLMWKDHFQWIGDPWAGVSPPDFIGNGSTNFCDQLLAHATNSYTGICPSDPTQTLLTNSLGTTIAQGVDNGTNATIQIHWDDIRYGTRNISTSDQWGNCVAVTLSMGGGFGAQVAVTNRALVMGQGMALFDARPGWPDSIGPGKRPVHNMCPTIVVPDSPGAAGTNALGGRPPFAIGGVGGSTIENNMAMQLIKYLMDSPSSRVTSPSVWLYNFEGNKTIYMRSGVFPTGVQSYLGSVGYSAPGAPPSVGEISYAEAFVPPAIVTQPTNQSVNAGNSASFQVTATGLPLFYQWLRNGVPLVDGSSVSGAKTPTLTLTSVTNGAVYSVLVTNGAASVTSAAAVLTVDGAPVIVSQPLSRTNFNSTLATFSVSAIGGNPLSYQWLKNGVPLSNGGKISGATNSQLNVDFVSTNDVGTYSVIVSNASGTVSSSGATLSVIESSTFMTLLWSVGPSDGQPWMNFATQSIPNQRTIAYNSLSNHLYVISRSSSTTSNYVIHVLNATNGALLYTLKTNGIQSAVGKQGIGLVGIAVADDGAIYACNEANDSAGTAGTDPSAYFRVYRWADGGSSTLPSLIFSADPTGTSSPLRWGDNLTVRGAGTNTEVLVDMTFFNSVYPMTGSNGFAAILSPGNQFMTNFVSRWFTTTNFADTVGRSLEFDMANNAIWQKGPGKALHKIAFDPTESLGATRIGSSNVAVYPSFPSSLMGVGLDLSRHFAAGVYSTGGSTPDSLRIYDIADLNSPVLAAQYNFPTTPPNGNPNKISQTFFKDDLLFSIDANNGLMVFRVINASLPQIVSPPLSRTNLVGTTATFTVSATGGYLAYQWLKDGALLSDGGNLSGANATTLVLTNVSFADAGSYSVIVTNIAGSITSAPVTLTVKSNPPSQLWLYEPFDYPNVGGPVSSNTPANWTYGGGGANDLSVVAENLFYPGLAEPIGNSVTNGGAGLGVRRLLGTNVSSGKIYFSALFRINDLGFGAWNGLASSAGALTATDSTSFRLSVVIKSNSPNGYIIGAQKSGTGATVSYSNTERHAGETVFLVGKYDFTINSNAISLWINPSPTTFGAVSEPASGFLYATTGQDGFTIDRFNMRQNAASGSSSVPASMQWDELRFGFSWAAVTPPGPIRLTGSIQQNGAFQFVYTNGSPQVFTIFSSSNLVNWVPVGSGTQISPGIFQFIDNPTTNIPQRYYQLRSEE